MATTGVQSAVDIPTTGRWSPGPLTSRRLRRTQMLYGLLICGGLIPFIIGTSASWKAAGLGLWLPGGGFVASGPWGLLLFALTFVMFLVSVFAWFAAGAVIAPVLVWLGSVAVSAAVARDPIWEPSPFVVAAMAAMLLFQLYRRDHLRRTRAAKSALQRAAILPNALVEARARAAPQTALHERELSDQELAGARYLLDRALQPVERFDGFDCIDIFQTAALRYQVNFLGYGLSQLQQLYTPNFHGYLSIAQRNAIQKYLQRRIWDYWAYESSWGHLNFTNWDPAARDNIMLTGYYGAQVALYCGNTGDSRYTVPGSLTFRLNDRKAWPHDVHSITRSVYDNFQRSAYCLYPCEPNWIYTGCNFRGMTTLVAHDRAYGTDYTARIREQWLAQLDREFTDAAGGIVGLRSSLTGLEFPFPSSDLGYCLMANTFVPERAERMWALVQFGLRHVLGKENGKSIVMLPNKGVDFGNYRRGNLGFAMGALLAGAHEFGDGELAEAALNTLDLRCEPSLDRGVLHYRKASNLANLYIATARFTRTADYRDVFGKPASKAALAGPILSQAAYPETLVARAVSNGEDLELVLLPGTDPGIRTIGLGRLVPNRAYRVDPLPQLSFTADHHGEAKLTLPLTGRTRLHIAPSW